MDVHLEQVISFLCRFIGRQEKKNISRFYPSTWFWLNSLACLLFQSDISVYSLSQGMAQWGLLMLCIVWLCLGVRKGIYAF